MSASENTSHVGFDEGSMPTKPSVAYEQATDSPVYRLSELMFGSLLASYVLGFVGFIAAKIAFQDSSDHWEIFLLSIKYTSISIAYAYLTASFYLTYHAGILTMHHMPLARLGFDFVLALAQAILFGYSMLFPRMFPIYLGLLLIAAIVRQEIEHRRHLKSIYRRIVKNVPTEEEDRDDPDTEHRRELRDFRHKFVKLLYQPLKDNSRKLKYQELTVWKPAGRGLKAASIVLFFGGIAFWYLVSINQLPEGLRFLERWQLSEGWVASATFIVGLLVLINGHKTIRNRATFLYDRKNKKTKMDDQFQQLLGELQTSSPRIR